MATRLRQTILPALLAVAMILLGSVPALTQSDSLRARPFSRDTTSAARRDTARAARPDSGASVSGVDTTINYSSADSIVYSIPAREMSLFGKGEIKYQSLQLKSDRIKIDWNRSMMTAYGVPDTSDTTGKKLKGTPVMRDGNEEYHGSELGYNFRTKKGRIDLANTTIDQGYYHGEEIKKVDRTTLFVADGRYTTCDKPEPHYFFGSPKMMVSPGQKVVAEPVYLYVADVPVFALPFGIFPNQHGRRSGIIPPKYGEDGQRGKFLSRLGYYWAISDYMDLSARTDLYTKGGWAAYADYSYALRYYFRGAISGQYKRLYTGESTDPNRTEDHSYEVSLRHNEDFDPTTRMDVDFRFASNNAYLNTIDLNQALNQFITSNASLSKSWEGTPNSIGLSVSRSQNLRTEETDETLPSLNFNHSQSYPLRWGASDADEESLPWYQKIGFSYGASAVNRRTKTAAVVGGFRATVNGRDTVLSVSDFSLNRSQSIQQNASLSIAPKLGYITVTPSLSYSDQRTFTNNDTPVRDTAANRLSFANSRESNRAGFLTTGISAATKLYAIAQPGLLGIAALRHTLTPSLSLQYSKQIVGEDPIGKQMTMGFNVGNIFEMKTMSHEEGKEGDKIQLLNIGAGISYNFSVDSLNFSPIGISYRTQIGSILDVSGNASYDLYKLDPVSLQRVNKFLINDEHRPARLTSFGISLSTSLSGQRSTSRQSPTVDTMVTRQQAAAGAYGMYQQEEEPDFSIPWRLGLSLDYSESKVPPFPSRSSNLRGNLEFNLTENWKFSMSGGYDVFNREVVVPNINISRDLHCWIMDFSWVPIGNYRSYQFTIHVKASQLQDIKVTKTGSERGIY